MRVALVILVICASGVRTVCNRTNFEDSWENGNVEWSLPPGIPSSPGTLRCNEGFVFNGTTDVVYCDTQGRYKLGDLKAKCFGDHQIDTKTVQFHGQTYKYTYIKVGSKTSTFPVLYPNTSYIITTNYTASKQTPTIRVRVGLIGKANKPVLVNIQQSTESVGFELPMKVVGKGARELAVNYSNTLREMCTTKNLTKEGREERVIVTVVSFEPKIHIHNENFSDPEIQVSFHVAQDALRSLDEPHKSKAKPNEDQWFFFKWDEVPKSVKFVVVNITSETEQCATVTVRNSSCSLYKENIQEYDHGMYLTMTRRAAIIVPRNHYPEVFYLSVLAETDDTPCGLPGNATGRHRIKPYEFNIHKHHESVGFLFLPLLIIPICSVIFIFGTIYIRYNDKHRTTSSGDKFKVTTMDSLSPTPAQINTEPSRSNTADSYTDELMPMTISAFEIPHTRVDYIPLIITLIVLPVFLDILSARLEQYHTFGQLDVCTFNVECSFPVGFLPDVGRAVTSFSYILMGFTLLLLVFTHHKKVNLKNQPDLITGVQHDYDILRAISYCIMLQGLIGFIYHICPNESVESLADMFLLIAIAYTCQKIFQNRHPDVRHKIFHPVYVTVFCIGLHGMVKVSVHRETLTTWIIFGGLHTLHIIAVPLQFILLDTLEIGLHPYLLYRNLPLFTVKFNKINTTQIVCGSVGIALNLAVMLCAVILQPQNFMLYLLSAFVVNLLLYLSYYILMKSVHHQEKIAHLHVALLTVVLLMWVMALYYLVFHTSISPGIAPALSREGAKPCIVFEMFDGHDAWHFFSAGAIFLTNFLVMIVDDCQANSQTSHLPVF